MSGTTPAQQMDFPSLAFGRDRTVLYVFECAEKLRCTEQHILDLIEEGKLRAVNIAGANASGRRCYRIPVEAWAEFIAASTA